jgi:lysophospholipase L1-like esterase
MDSNLRTLVESTRAMGASPIFWTPPPVPRWPNNFKSPTHFEIQLQILEFYHQIIQRVARDLNIPTVDFWKTFPGLVEEYPGPYFNHPDGYHSNDKSQPIIAKGIAEIVKPMVETWRKTQAGRR